MKSHAGRLSGCCLAEGSLLLRKLDFSRYVENGGMHAIPVNLSNRRSKRGKT